jgi:hypothetical protein
LNERARPAGASSATSNTYHSNQRGQSAISFGTITASLVKNKNPNKVEVAREKILETHFTGKHSDIQAFATITVTVLPNAMEWIGRERENLESHVFDDVSYCPKPPSIVHRENRGVN